MADKEFNYLYVLFGAMQFISIMLVGIVGYLLRGFVNRVTNDIHETRREGCDVSRKHIEWHRGHGDFK